MKHVSILFVPLSLSWWRPRPSRADESLAPETARRLKEATVYVKVAIGPLRLSGSGFVIQAAADSALIVTNQHVVTKPRILEPMGFHSGSSRS